MKEKIRVFYKDKDAVERLYKGIREKMYKCGYREGQEIVVVCVGTDRSTGDSLGPLVGNRFKSNIDVIGDLKDPVHASNIDEMIDLIDYVYKDPFIISIDAGLGKKESVGYIDVCDGALKPGSGVGKKLNQIGDIHIVGIVNIGGYMEYLVLQSTRLYVIMKMSDLIVQSLNRVLNSEVIYKNIKNTVDI